LSATAVWSTFFAGAVGLAASAAVVAEFDANTVPLHFTTEGVLGADTSLTLAAAAGRERGGFAATGTFATISRAIGATLSLVSLADAISTNGVGNADAEVGALIAVKTEATLVAAAIGATLFAHALGLADVFAQAVVANVAGLADTALTLTTIGPTFHAITLRYADSLTLSVDAFCSITAVATGATASVRTTLLAVTCGSAGDAGKIELIAFTQKGRFVAAIWCTGGTGVGYAIPNLFELCVFGGGLVGAGGTEIEALVTQWEAAGCTVDH